jgi:SAM-dependent methyltransferase
MSEYQSAADQFGPVAAEYARFSYHAAGPDLGPMLEAGAVAGHERVLDIGCGPGHTALLFAPHVSEVVALDPTEAMLDQGRRLAAERGIHNLSFTLSGAEDIPFPARSFQRVTSRQSAHHYRDVRAVLKEVTRVLDDDGVFVLIDTVSPEDDEFDEFLNRIELLRDPTHVRDYRVSEWREMFGEVGLELDALQHWGIPLEFESWVSRSRTPAQEVAELRRCLDGGEERVARYFEVQESCDWVIPVALMLGRRPIG